MNLIFFLVVLTLCGVVFADSHNHPVRQRAANSPRVHRFCVLPRSCLSLVLDCETLGSVVASLVSAYLTGLIHLDCSS
jgi:hypothetical protein